MGIKPEFKVAVPVYVPPAAPAAATAPPATPPREKQAKVIKPDAELEKVAKEKAMKEEKAKKKAGDVTELVWKALLRESAKLNWTPEQAVTYCCEKSWVNLDASWIKDKSVKPMKGYGFVSDAQFNDWLESAPTQERIANE